MTRKKTVIHIWLLSFLSSVLLSIPFIVPHCGIVAIVAFVPLLAAEYLAKESKLRHFWIIYYISFLIWNIITTYWIYLATLPGAIAAVTLNALQMSLVFALFRWMKRNTGGFLPYLFFIIIWLAWEHSYFNWSISWPWLVLGNSFSSSVSFVQWYEFTGTLGGSLWILLVNVLLFRVIIMACERKHIVASVSTLAAVIFLPVIVSVIMYSQYGKKLAGDERNEVAFSILQPNIDPYNDKFGGISQREQTIILLSLARSAVGDSLSVGVLQTGNSAANITGKVAGELPNNRIILAPETFFSPSGSFDTFLDEDAPLINSSFREVYSYMSSLNHSCHKSNYSIIVGAVTDKIYPRSDKTDSKGRAVQPTSTARSLGDGMRWYDRFNAAVFVGSDGKVDYYHKSKLVVLVETTPFTGVLQPLEKFAIDLGGAVGSFGTQKERSVFKAGSDSVRIGTAICYESVYGDFYRDYVLKGAQVMSIITNDGWWGNTAGYIQHLNYASLRAIETRRSIARCANTGISAFINERGDIISETKWWEPAYLNGRLPLNDRITVFVEYGDIIGRIAVFLSMLFILLGIVKHISKKYIIRGEY